MGPQRTGKICQAVESEEEEPWEKQSEPEIGGL